MIRGRRARVVRRAAFAQPPAVVAAARADRLPVHFFARGLADVGDHQRAGAAVRPVVEVVAPRIAQAERPDLRQRGDRLPIDERVVVGHAVAARIGVRHVDVDAQHLAEQRVRVLRVVQRIAAAAAVAQADVEIAVGTKRQVAAVVIRERLLDEAAAVGPHQVEARAGIDRALRVARVARDHGVAVEIGEVDVEAPRGRVVGREREPEQPALAARRRSPIEGRGTTPEPRRCCGRSGWCRAVRPHRTSRGRAGSMTNATGLVRPVATTCVRSCAVADGGKRPSRAAAKQPARRVTCASCFSLDRSTRYCCSHRTSSGVGCPSRCRDDPSPAAATCCRARSTC